MIPGNSTKLKIDTWSFCSTYCCCLVVPYVYWSVKKSFKVPNNSFAFVLEDADDGRKTVIYGPGFHIIGYYNEVQGIYSFDKRYPNNIIESKIGDLKLAIVY